MTESFTIRGDCVVLGVRYKNTQNGVGADEGNTIIDKNETSKLENKALEALKEALKRSVYARTPGQVASQRNRDRASNFARRLRVTEIKNTQLENRTPEENELLHAAEQARTKKNHCA